MLGPEINVGLDAVPVQSYAVVVAGKNFGENLPSLVCSYVN